MLSSQTKDAITASAMTNLKQHGLTVDNICHTDLSTLDQLISKVGFHSRKANYIKKATEIISRQYGGDPPENYDEIVAFPGVGPKMAHLYLQEACNKTEGIGVDVHVHRISNRLGWVKTTTPEATRKELEKWLPRDRWRPINKLLVGFGQTVCLPVGPKCLDCRINHLCPFFGNRTNNEKMRRNTKRKENTEKPTPNPKSRSKRVTNPESDLDYEETARNVPRKRKRTL